MNKQNNGPHNNSYWQEQRDKRDIQRILENKPVAKDSNIKFTRGSGYGLILKFIFSRGHSFSIGQRAQFAKALLSGLWLDFRNKIFPNNPQQY